MNVLQAVLYSPHSQNKIKTSCTNDGIEFKFIPPSAPHFGWLWEAAVKSAKYHLVKGTAGASLTYEELETVVIGVERVLNSRPLRPMSNNPNDLAALTPGHFLIGEPVNAIPNSKAQDQGHQCGVWFNKSKMIFGKDGRQNILIPFRVDIN